MSSLYPGFQAGGRSVYAPELMGNLLVNPSYRPSWISLTNCEADFAILLRLGGGVEYQGGQVIERRKEQEVTVVRTR